MKSGVVCEVSPIKLLVYGQLTLTMETEFVEIFLVIMFLLFRKEAGDVDRRGSSLFKNMPFLHTEDALLEERRASSVTLYVTH